MTLGGALLWTNQLIALAVLLQTIELLQIRKTFSADGVWRWSTLEKEFAIFPKFSRKLLDFFLKTPNFTYLLFFRASVALLAMALLHPGLIFAMLLITILICLRWRGVFNGGSDYMTIVVLSALAVATLFPENDLVVAAALLYIAVQSCSSYFISGIVKIKRKNWRSGIALPVFLSSGIYTPPQKLITSLNNKYLAQFASWSIILFECTFPVALFIPTLTLPLLGAALLFHILNFYILGLNRFIYAWAASYPAIYYCSRWIEAVYLD